MPIASGNTLNGYTFVRLDIVWNVPAFGSWLISAPGLAGNYSRNAFDAAAEISLFNTARARSLQRAVSRIRLGRRQVRSFVKPVEPAPDVEENI